MLRGFRYRFYPTLEQETLLRRTIGCVRLVYNKALHARSEAWTTAKKSIGYIAQSAALTAWKKLPELAGRYLYADYISGRLWALRYDEAKQRVTENHPLRDHGVISGRHCGRTFGQSGPAGSVDPGGFAIYRLGRFDKCG